MRLLICSRERWFRPWCRYLIPAEIRLYQGPEGEAEITDAGLIWRIHHGFHRGFERMRGAYCGILTSALAHRKLVLVCFLAVSVSCVALYPLIGTDFFPNVDAGQIRLHVRCPGGTRIEETEQKFAEVEESIRRIIPREELSDILDNIGLPYSGSNIAFSDSVTLGLGRRRDSGFAAARQAPLHLGLCPGDAPAAEPGISRSRIFLSAGRHGRTDSEFWITGAHRRSGGGAATQLAAKIKYWPPSFQSASQPSPERSTFTCTRSMTFP